MTKQQKNYGLIGLGTMGRNLLLNMADQGFDVVGFDKNHTQTDLMNKEKGDRSVTVYVDLKAFIKHLKMPRTIFLLVPAGEIVDEVIEELKPLLEKNDLIVDCGNSHYTDTNLRIESLQKSNIQFMGVGISGGEQGARFGPSIMPGGKKEIYERLKGVFEAIAAKVKGEPCVNWLGEGAAGHYVKMVHNGIEYAIMQLLAEVYHFLKIGRCMNNDELFTVFSRWNNGILKSYLIEITAEIFKQKDELSKKDLIDSILDSAKQKGTGGWTSEDAIKLQIPTPTIDAAVFMRDLSAAKNQRELINKQIEGPAVLFENDNTELLAWLEQALYFAMMTSYAQGFALLQAASKTYGYNLKPEDIAKVWKGGCIIRAEMLDKIQTAFEQQTELWNLMMDETIAHKLMHKQHGLRKVIQMGVEAGLPLPAFMSALSYYDAYRSAWLPANLIQAQRDLFGAHTYERNDRAGIFHSQWHQNKVK